MDLAAGLAGAESNLSTISVDKSPDFAPNLRCGAGSIGVMKF
jgi:hypothetical protein